MLQRNLRFSILFLVLGALLAGAVHVAAQKNSSGPRALAVVEVPEKGQPRLIPITILDNGKFYDASAYKAEPVPMSLEYGTVYDVERNGESIGLLTVERAAAFKGTWWLGTGHLQRNDELKPAPKAKPAPIVEPGDERPILRRPQQDAAAGPAAPASDHANAPATEPPKAQPAGAPAAPPQAKAPATTSSAPSNPYERDIPTLRRGKPQAALSADFDEALSPAGGLPNTPASSAPKAAPASPAPAAPSTPVAQVKVDTLLAISDAGGPEPRSFAFKLKPDEQAGYEKALDSMAVEAVRKFAAARPALRPGQPKLTEATLRAFDVNLSNQPLLVYSARQAEQAAKGTLAQPAFYYVTLVARVNIDGTPRRIFEAVTDTSHLDALPRLDLVGMADAEGKNSGNLVFREVYDRGIGYIVYHVGLDRLFKLFEGATAGR